MVDGLIFFHMSDVTKKNLSKIDIIWSLFGKIRKTLIKTEWWVLLLLNRKIRRSFNAEFVRMNIHENVMKKIS